MELERCPYDSSPVSVQAVDDGFVVACDACGASWEMRGSRISRLRAPDPETMQAVRDGLFRTEVVCGKRSALHDDTHETGMHETEIRRSAAR